MNPESQTRFQNPQNPSSPSDAAAKQRETASEIARKKVLAAYKNLPTTTHIPVKAPDQLTVTSPTMSTHISVETPETTTATQNPPATSHIPVKSSHLPDLKTYHSAWQNYYQKYYSEYYSQAAKEYIKREQQNPSTNPPAVSKTPATAAPKSPIESVLRRNIAQKSSDAAAQKRRHKKFRPLLAGAAVALLLLFLQYNRLIFAPLAAYVSPMNTTDTSITSIDPTIAMNVGDESRLIIPKLNIDVPILFGLSNDSDTIMEGMNSGVVHWSIPGASALPGEIGNLVITGHSAGDIYTNNQYKFIFSGLERLGENDLIYVDYGGVRYTYSVTKLETVDPSEVSRLVYDTDKPMLTLITCTPLGTSRYRLLVTAEQISPAPSGTTQTEQTESGASEMVGNAPTFFEAIFGKH